MDDTLKAKMEALSQKILDTKFLVGKLLVEELPQVKETDAANQAVADISAAFREMVAGLPPSEELMLERKLGRQVTDLRRQASALPQKSFTKPVALASNGGQDGQWNAFMAPAAPAPRADPNKAPHVSAAQAAVERARRGPGVGEDIDSWCGPCDGLVEHTIVAMVDNKPKAVICRACGARHNYRTDPPRRRKPAAVSASAARKRKAPVHDKALRKEQERNALKQQLVEATDVRPYNKRARYRAGEIIEHPEFGRGKIENVLKGSMLVRFADRLRSLR